MQQPTVAKRPVDAITADEVRANGHLARYIMATMISFPNVEEATFSAAELAAGRMTFMQLLQAHSNPQQQQGGGGGGGISNDAAAASQGNMAFIRIDQIDAAIARVAFDIRLPTATPESANLIGPVCIYPLLTSGKRSTIQECVLIAVMQRYRHGFFSDAFYEIEAFIVEEGLPLSRLIEVFNKGGDFVRMLSYAVWPDDDVNMKKTKIAQVRADLARIGTEDFSSKPTLVPRSRGDTTLHTTLLDKRAQILNRIDPKVIEAHPEIYGMSLEQMATFVEDLAGQGIAGTLPAEERNPEVFVKPAE
jgi:hypothetical protein